MGWKETTEAWQKICGSYFLVVLGEKVWAYMLPSLWGYYQWTWEAFSSYGDNEAKGHGCLCEVSYWLVGGCGATCVNDMQKTLLILTFSTLL